MIRPLLRGAGIGLLGVVLTSAPVGAEGITSGGWKGSYVYHADPDGAGSLTDCARDVCGTFRWTPPTTISPDRKLTVTATMTRTADAHSGACPAEGTTTSGASQNNRVDFSLAFPCNGHYKATAQAYFIDGLGTKQSSATITHELDVKRPAPEVAGVAWAAGAERAVVISWSHANQPADVEGYRVLRLDSADWTTVADLGPDAVQATDANPPAAGGPTTYRVAAVRSGLTSVGGLTTADVAPAPSDTSAPGGDDGGTNTGTDSGPGGPGSPTTVPGGGSTNGDRTPTRVTPRHSNRVIIRAPRVGRPSNAFFPPLLTPPSATEVDTGFDPELPYDPETGEPSLPGDELASSPGDEGPGRGLAIPAATALVLAVWAFHLRYLAKASKPVYVDDFLEPFE